MDVLISRQRDGAGYGDKIILITIEIIMLLWNATEKYATTTHITQVCRLKKEKRTKIINIFPNIARGR